MTNGVCATAKASLVRLVVHYSLYGHHGRGNKETKEFDITF